MIALLLWHSITRIALGDMKTKEVFQHDRVVSQAVAISCLLIAVLTVHPTPFDRILVIVFSLIANVFVWLSYNVLASVAPASNPTQFQGHDFPTINLKDSQDIDFITEELLEKPTMFLFFRGVWCPFCIAQIKQLKSKIAMITEKGIQVVLVSLDQPEKLENLRKELELPFMMLSDSTTQLARYFDVFHADGTPPPVKLIEGTSDTMIPTIVFTMNGKIEHFERTEDFTVRPDPDQLFKSFDEIMIRRQLKVKVDEQTKELEKMVHGKAQLVRVLVHDIANTFMLIEGAGLRSQMMLKNSQAVNREELSKLWDKAFGALEIQREIISSTREMEAIQAGSKRISLSKVCLADVLKRCRLVFEEKLVEKKIHLKFDESELKGLFVVGDFNILSTNIFCNLISNAIKFTPEGGTIEVGGRKENERVVVFVKDSGIGIPPDLKENLFRIDKQTSRKGTNGEKGTGFGMPIVKSYVEILGAKIDVESKTEEKTGTKFSLDFKKAA